MKEVGSGSEIETTARLVFFVYWLVRSVGQKEENIGFIMMKTAIGNF